ncbi:MAG: hypothetical protein R2713_10255 [Ilumatobacteraceae bacterium]
MFFDGCGDRVLEVGDLVDDGEDAGDRVDRGGGVGLDGFDLGGDVFGGFGGLFGEFFDFAGDDGEALPASLARLRWWR